MSLSLSYASFAWRVNLSSLGSGLDRHLVFGAAEGEVLKLHGQTP